MSDRIPCRCASPYARSRYPGGVVDAAAVTMPQQDYETFIGSAYAGPIFVLVEKLEDSRGRTNQVQSSPYEHGYSAAVIALTVLFVESYLNVSKYLTGSSDRRARLYFRAT